MRALPKFTSYTDLRDILCKAGLFLDCGLISLSENYPHHNFSTESFLQAQRFVGMARTCLTSYGADLPAPTDYIPYSIGNRIQIAREEIGMSLDDLAAAVIPDDVEVVSEWENGKSEPCASEIIRLSQALKCDPMWLLTGKECAK